MATKKGNLNALKNGSKLSRTRLTIGELPDKLIAAKREARAYRRAIEAAVIDCKGAISLVDAHALDTATAATLQAGILRWLLRNRLSDMSTSDVAKVTADIVKAKTLRDRAIARLGLDDEQDPWAEAFDGTVKDE